MKMFEYDADQYISDMSSWPWFENIGKDFYTEKYIVLNKNEFLLSDFELWINETDYRRNKLTRYLSSHCVNEYQKWNELVGKFRKIIKPIIDQKLEFLPDELSNIDDFCASVRWDCLHGVMEIAYKDAKPPNFFRNLLDIYQSGHIPCGIENNSGKIVIY